MLFEVFKQDEQFKLYLAEITLEKLKAGQPISKSQLFTFAHSALDLKDVRYQVANYLVNTEHFYSMKSKTLF